MQKVKKEKPKCTVCGRKIKQYLLCPSCNRMLGEGYTREEILRYYRTGV
ncbi:hypothetical protein Sam46_gp37 [Bacillus phage vB_BcM_Sam46]|uniref:Uncharacterized protein n=2 Tax=Caudoviricetes TaxID=2731619 RepID=A0A6G9L6V6_9CAUD|nr:hypothetical protein Sam112_gp36 [Bacillus phage vB_BcM_Sam112]QIQ61238.1 hypothetical protein Sam46_gp37 [Bacillus phage vB_BcM_Sam46]